MFTVKILESTGSLKKKAIITYIPPTVLGDNHCSFWCIYFQSFFFLLFFWIHTFYKIGIILYNMFYNITVLVVYHSIIWMYHALTNYCRMANLYFFTTGKAIYNLVKQMEVLFGSYWLDGGSLFKTNSRNTWILI